MLYWNSKGHKPAHVGNILEMLEQNVATTDNW